MDSVRIDRWLWAARFFKTRSQANRACTEGNVIVNDAVVKAGKLVRVDDHIVVKMKGGWARIAVVVALTDKRGSGADAQALYEDHTPPPPPKEERVAVRERGTGRPVKRQRRILNRLRRRN